MGALRFYCAPRDSTAKEEQKLCLSHNPTKNRTELNPGFVEANVRDANCRQRHGQSTLGKLIKAVSYMCRQCGCAPTYTQTKSSLSSSS
ncbi:hypothetical protein J6590_088297 [Homalodisca vitripennis]|nr:hypothetical protein J6590_088297 [Homalodisca vitripennis]